MDSAWRNGGWRRGRLAMLIGGAASLCLACGFGGPTSTPTARPTTPAVVATVQPSPTSGSSLGSDDFEAPPPELAALLTRQRDLKRARFQFESSIAITTLGATDTITTVGDGALALPDQFTIRLGGSAYESVGEAEIVAVGSSLGYIRLGQQWLELDQSQAFVGLAAGFGANVNPLRALSGATDVQPLPNETIHGQPTKVFAFRLPSTRLTQPALPGAQPPPNVQWQRGTGQVWINEAGYIARLTSKLEGRANRGGDAVATTQLDLAAFDDPSIEIRLPAGVTPAPVRGSGLGPPSPSPTRR